MTRREALEVLVGHAAANVAGVGCGVRPEMSAEQRQRVADAVLKVWPLFRSYSPGENDFHNLKLPRPAGLGRVPKGRGA